MKRKRKVRLNGTCFCYKKNCKVRRKCCEKAPFLSRKRQDTIQQGKLLIINVGIFVVLSINLDPPSAEYVVKAFILRVFETNKTVTV